MRQPLQKIEKEKKIIQKHITERSAKSYDYTTNMRRTDHIYQEKYIYWFKFKQTDTTGKIAAYLDDLKNERYVSKLYLAGFLTSQRITKLVEDNKEYLSRTHELYRNVWFDFTSYAFITCMCNYETTNNPLMRAFYAKVYEHYKSATDSERNAMDIEYYCVSDNISSIVRSQIRGPMVWEECDNFLFAQPPQFFNNISLQNLTSFQNGLQTFLERTRLNGHFFRYFVAIDTYDSSGGAVMLCVLFGKCFCYFSGYYVDLLCIYL